LKLVSATELWWGWWVAYGALCLVWMREWWNNGQWGSEVAKRQSDT